jgi:hypothetical protein
LEEPTQCSGFSSADGIRRTEPLSHFWDNPAIRRAPMGIPANSVATHGRICKPPVQMVGEVLRRWLQAPRR